jgi:cobalt-zinc-cadmium efflux system membrane fusion protein
VRARFAGIVKTVNVNWGEDVKKGQVLATIESNESLRSYNITAPIDGVVLARNTNVGDVADAESLFTVADLSNVWAEFHVFPRDLENVKKDQVVEVHTLGKGKETVSKISMLLPTADALSQTVIAVVPLDNPDGKWRPGMTVEGDVLIDQREVPLAVRTSALQKFRDFTVVFAKFGEQYEVRMLELGTNDGEWVEVLEGLKPNTEYVTENSFLIKADIEKSGASHDH